MAILPWQHSRSRTKSSGQDKHLLSGPQDWFSRHTTEPSRQALTDLVKEHKREKSDDTKASKTRSRGNTITSNEWPNNNTIMLGSDNVSSRSTSPQQTREGSIYSSFDRSESGAKALLSKGGLMLRRSGSKMSLSSAASGSNSNLIGTLRQGSVTPSMRPHDDLRQKISAPFDFQHVAHTEQNQVAGLGKIDESALVNQFPPAIKRSSGCSPDDVGTGSNTSQPLPYKAPSRSSQSSLLGTEPPAPPPKDVTTDEAAPLASASPVSAGYLQSGPTTPAFPSKHTPTAIDTSLVPSEEIVPPPSAKSLLAMSDNADCAKPLPMLPVIHAVTTEDGSARAMMSVPLPTTPNEANGSVDGRPSPTMTTHQRQKSSVVLPRHFSLRPSAKASMPNLLSNEITSPAQQPLSRVRSDIALSQQARMADDYMDPRMSMSFNAINTMNWEDAVDEAWDDADQYEDDSIWTQRNSAYFLPNHNPPSALRVNGPSGPLPLLPSSNSPLTSGSEGHKLESVLEDEHQIDLSGLGISTTPVTGAGVGNLANRSSGSVKSKRRSSQYLRPDLTRSSSQESIILSIASSIMGTQRSSNSSLMPEDILGVQAIEEESVHDMVELESVSKIRPESGCLPPNVLQQMTQAGLHLPAATTPPVPPLPPASPAQHKHSKSVPRGVIPDRISSVAANQPATRSGRGRSNTTGARPRQSARISYSLFPTAAPSPSTGVNP